MKKKLLSLLCIALSILTVFSVSACNNNPPVAPSGDGSNNKEIKETDIYLTENGRTDYTIVIPQKASQYEEYAAEELKLYMKESTNANFSIITDAGLSYDDEQKYISIGRTNLMSASEVQADAKQLGTDGYVIKRQNNVVILCGGGEPGTLYSVYEFLNKQVGFEPYDSDEIYFDKAVNVKLRDFDIVDVPALPDRQGGFFSAATDPYFAAKRKTCAGAGIMPFGGEKWYYFGHSMFRVVPISTYGDLNPSWYAASRQQPCFSSEGFKKQYIENAKKLFLDSSTLIYIGIGLEDVNNKMCACNDCQEDIDKYTETGLVIRWTNEVTKIMRDWAEEINLGREIYFPFIAYYDILNAPVRNNPQTGEYEPIDPSLVLNDHSPVLYADIHSEWADPWDSPDNAGVYEGIKKWQACASNFIFYNYTNNFGQPFEWWDSLHVIARNYALAEQFNGIYLHDDSSNGTLQGFAFQRMYGYVASKLLWDPTLDVNELCINYINNYYKEAKEEVLEYYYMMKVQCRTEYGKYIENSSSWANRGSMDKAIALLKKGREDIQSCPYYTAVQKDLYTQRIELEMCTPIWYILDNLANDYSTTMYLNYVDEMETLVGKYGIGNLCWWEGQNGYKPNEQIFNEWRSNKSL